MQLPRRPVVSVFFPLFFLLSTKPQPPPLTTSTRSPRPIVEGIRVLVTVWSTPVVSFFFFFPLISGTAVLSGAAVITDAAVSTGRHRGGKNGGGGDYHE